MVARNLDFFPRLTLFGFSLDKRKSVIRIVTRLCEESVQCKLGSKFIR